MWKLLVAKEERGIPVAVRGVEGEYIGVGLESGQKGLGPRGGVMALSKRVTSPNFMLQTSRWQLCSSHSPLNPGAQHGSWPIMCDKLMCWVKACPRLRV